MPDIWTKHPDVVRDILEEAGFKCGVQPTILPRKPKETCSFKGERLYGEIYIHKLEENEFQKLIQK